MATKVKEKEISQEELAELNAAVPVIGGNKRESYPRFGLLAKDIVEESGIGKKKVVTVVQAAGTFFTNKDTGESETGDDGKVVKKWDKVYLDDEETVDVIIAFHRRQLRLFDSGLNKFLQSPLYDTPDQIIPLYIDGRETMRGTQEQLQAKFPALTEKGKKSSKLKEVKVLYLLYKGEQYQTELSTSSKWAFQDYARKTGVATVVTALGSVEETFGTNTYRKMTFSSKRLINREELELVKEFQNKLKDTVESDRKFLESKAAAIGIGSGKDADADMVELVESAKGAL